MLCQCVTMPADKSYIRGNNSNLNVLAAISTGTWAVKLCTNKILQLLSGAVVCACFMLQTVFVNYKLFRTRYAFTITL